MNATATVKRKRDKVTLFDIFNFFIFIALVFLCVYPFYYVVIYSFSNAKEAAQGVFLWPKGFSLKSYEVIFADNRIFRAFFVSLSRTVLGTVITVVCSSFFAYLVAQPNMMFRKFVYRFLIITMYLNAGLIPWYLTMRMYGLKDNFLLYIIPGAISAYYVILVKTYIESLPPALSEAARIDGAGILTVYMRIILPLATPIIATIAVFECVNQWNSWMDNYFLVSSQSLKTLQYHLYEVLKNANAVKDLNTRTLASTEAKSLISSQTVKMCITFITTAPILFAYPFLQRYFVKGIMMGAVKG